MICPGMTRRSFATWRSSFVTRGAEHLDVPRRRFRPAFLVLRLYRAHLYVAGDFGFGSFRLQEGQQVRGGTHPEGSRRERLNTVIMFPQEHRQTHQRCLLEGAMTVNFPKTLPIEIFPVDSLR